MISLKFKSIYYDNYIVMNMQARAISGQRTLILTHLRKAEPLNLRMCTKLWDLTAPASNDKRVFDKRLSLVEEGGNLPEDVSLGHGDNKVFSWTGALDDATPPHAYLAAMEEFIPASQMGFAEPGFQQMFLGGGNLQFCLLNIFKSLIRIKVAQGESLQAVIPLAMVYFSKKVSSPLEYIEQPNHYTKLLEEMYKKGEIDSYLVTIDGNHFCGRFPSGPMIELHWFSSLKQMFASPFFPEINSPVALQKLIHYFGERR